MWFKLDYYQFTRMPLDEVMLHEVYEVSQVFRCLKTEHLATSAQITTLHRLKCMTAYVDGEIKKVLKAVRG